MSQVNSVTKIEQCELGKKSEYAPHYNADVLFPMLRQGKRDEIGITGVLPFVGFDIWNHYEVSWLNEKGKPIVAVAELIYSCESKYIIESKSMKLYFNSFNNSKFKSTSALIATIERDLSFRVGMPVGVKINDLSDATNACLYAGMEGMCLDSLDVDCSVYKVDSNYLATETGFIEETLYSNLLKSNCLVTNQPDWATVQIQYKGNKITHEGLLKYLVSFRNHNEFHEQCIERIFMDILTVCKPEALAIYGRYTRRGGLDINVYRGTSNRDPFANNQRLIRQ